jgi:hypothetical protein
MSFRMQTALAGALILASAAAFPAVTRIEITKREPFAVGKEFGSVGAYERVQGRFYGELDPKHPLNRGVVDLNLAPKNARGMVEYAADLDILKPVDMARGNGSLLYDVNNRGNKVAVRMFNDTTPNNLLDKPEHAGDGFLFRNGFTVVWSGWIPDSMLGPAPLLRFYAPVAEGLKHKVWDEFLFNDTKQTRARLTFRAASTDKAQAVLTVRGRNDDTPSVIQGAAWEFVDDRTIRLLPAGTPFAIGQMYQLTYTAVDAPIAGASLAATRDLVAFLREGKPDPAGNPSPVTGIRVTLAHGTSQSGRFLRDLVYYGFNESEDGKRVFDGMNPHIASQRIYLNHRFAQPNRMTHVAHGFMFFPDVGFPFAYETQTDPFTGASDGILARCAARGNCPKVMHTVTGTEYWQSGQSLITTDPLGSRDGTPPDSVRIYHFAGTQHIEIQTMPKGVCATPFNPVDYRPLLRAALASLDRWVKDGTPPPPSRHPRIADGSLAEMAASDAAIPGLPPAKSPNPRPRIDYGPDFGKGIIGRTLPVALKDSYRVLVPKVDADGNETGGIRLPDIAVPTATTTGWAVRGAEAGAAGELCYLDGSSVPFARTKSEREANRDPRLSLQERYRDRADYLAKVQTAAGALAQERYLLPEDVQRIADRAASFAW